MVISLYEPCSMLFLDDDKCIGWQRNILFSDSFLRVAVLVFSERGSPFCLDPVLLLAYSEIVVPFPFSSGKAAAGTKGSRAIETTRCWRKRLFPVVLQHFFKTINK
ncbi:hypothetical protein HQ43_06160 [Porphyromonas canoris]|uniref:Uncharacterized protein n=1 Tax=Porphyromonas canoris TaxID=36875 RepID=A0ABR4XJQ4_9PORP|nr:hypothetical protein HQ43_06160 [Porphyromonas canoris]